MNTRFARSIVAVFAAMSLLLGGAVACSDSKANAAADVNCIHELDAQQVADTTEAYKGQQTDIQADANGTSTVCIFKDDGRGGYSQQYYDRDDNFSDYLLYAAMTGRANSLMGFGVLSGAIEPFDAIILGSLYGVNSRGGVYQPFGYTDQGWGRQNTTINNVTIRNVSYGNSAPVPFKDAAKKRPSSYKPATVAKPSDKVATLKGSTLVEDKGKSAKTVLKNAKSAPAPGIKLPGAKNNARQLSIPNPAAAKAAKPSTAASKSASTKAPTSAKKSPTTSRKPAPKPTVRKPANKPASKPATRHK